MNRRPAAGGLEALLFNSSLASYNPPVQARPFPARSSPQRRRQELTPAAPSPTKDLPKGSSITERVGQNLITLDMNEHLIVLANSIYFWIRTHSKG